MIASHNKDTDSKWKLVKQIRADYLWKYLSPSFYSCKFIDNSHMEINFDMLAEVLNVPNVTEEVLDISLDKLNEGAKMFLYLNSCPSSFSVDLKTIFSSSDAYTVIMSTMKLLKSSKGKALDTMIKIFNAVSSEYGNNYSKISYEPTAQKLDLYKNLTIVNGSLITFN